MKKISKILTVCTGLIFLSILLCSSFTPLAKASNMGDCSDTHSRTTSSESACDHSEKLSLVSQGERMILGNDFVPAIVSFTDLAASLSLTSFNKYAYTELQHPPDSYLISYIRSHQTIVLRV